MDRAARQIGPCRPLSTAEAGRCAAIHRSAFASGWSTAEFESLLADQGVVADAIGHAPISGFVLSRKAADEAEILTIAIDGASRQRGLGGSLLGYHMSRLGRMGVARLFLEVDESNVAANALYRRYGFRRVGGRTGYYRLGNGLRTDAWILRCDL